MILHTNRPLYTVCWSVAVILFLSTGTIIAESTGEEFFEKSIRPILVEKCVSCHGPKVQKAGLRLDSRDAAIEGGSLQMRRRPPNPTRLL